MKVAIEGSPFYRVRTGIDHYALNLIRELVTLDSANDYTIIGYRGDQAKQTPMPASKNLAYHFANWLPKRYLDGFSTHLFVPPLDALSLVRPDVMLFPSCVSSPLLWTRRSIVMIYDLGKFPAAYSIR